MTTATSRTVRTIKYGSNVLVGTLLFFVVLAAINFLAAKSRWRLDITASKQYTVSEATKKLLGQLKDKVTVTVYATEQDTPPQWTEQRNQLRDLLAEYRLLSNRKVSYVFKDPTGNDKLEQEARQANIREQAMRAHSETEASVKLGYLGVVVQYSGKTETIPVILPQTSLEYQLTRAINKVAQVNVPKIGFMAPGGNPFMRQQGRFDILPQLFEKEGYEVKPLEANQLGELKGMDMLMIFEPEELSEEALYRIDQFVMNGGKLFVAAKGVQIDEQSGRAEGKAPNINSVLESYGIRIDTDLVEDWGKGVTTEYLTQRGVVPVTNPFVMEVTDLSKTSDISKGLERLFFLYPSSLSKSEHGTSATMEILAKTSDQSKKQEQFFILQHERLKRPKSEKLEAFNLVMSVKGKLDSRYAVVDPPALTEDGGTTRPVAASEVLRTSKDTAQVIVASSPFSFYGDILAQQAPMNFYFLSNMADVLTRGGKMIELRGKERQTASLRPNITPQEAGMAQVLAIVGVPVLLILFGIVKFYVNRMKKARYREIYGAPVA